jgi:diacylglycerol kinase
MKMIKQFLKSFSHALRGVRVVFTHEQNFRIQIVAAAVVVFAGTWFGVTRNEWIVLLLLIAAVLGLELMNAIIERLADAFKPRIHPIIKEVKDMMAATVLIVSFIAAIIGVIIFYPYLAPLVGLGA